MKTTIKTLLAGLLIVPVIALAANLTMSTIQPEFAGAVGTISEGAEAGKGTGMPTTLLGADSVFTTISNVALYVIGAVSVLMLIYGGIKYTISGGDTGAVTSAKNTILYAIIGIVVALLAYAIVNFVLTQFVVS